MWEVDVLRLFGLRVSELLLSGFCSLDLRLACVEFSSMRYRELNVGIRLVLCSLLIIAAKAKQSKVRIVALPPR